MVLINTLYFKGNWSTPYETSFPDEFTNYNGEKVEYDCLSSNERYYIKGDGYTGFQKKYNGSCSFVGILPDEGTDIYDFVKGLDSEELLSSISEPIDIFKLDGFNELRTSMPMIKYSDNMTLQDQLRAMGLVRATDPEQADFSAITDTWPLFIDKVIHKTAIEINKSGTTAAAVTAVMMNATSAAPVAKNIIRVYLDRPYVYMIVDDTTHLPLFIGAVTQIPQN